MVNPKTDERLYEAIWIAIGERVGYGIDCDVLTDKVIDIVNEWLATKPTKDAK
jgi:hypothetical protein